MYVPYARSGAPEPSSLHIEVIFKVTPGSWTDDRDEREVS